FTAVTTTPAIGFPCMSSTVPVTLEYPALGFALACPFCGTGASGNSADRAARPKSEFDANPTINKHHVTIRRRKVYSWQSFESLSLGRSRIRRVIRGLHPS